MIPSNYHTHTLFCDGKNSPEELVEEAIKLGCSEIGFSGHSYTSFDESYCMSKSGTEEYKRCVNDLKEKYATKINILLGIEQDFYSDEPTDDYDFIIGSVHYIKKRNHYLAIDESLELQQKIVAEYYGGDFYKFIADYYKIVGDLYEKTKCDIIGHFDLVTKFNEGDTLFDTKSQSYILAADAAIKKLIKTPAIFEINTGAVARGYRLKPYPEKRIIDILLKHDKKIIKNSDCHSKEFLLFGL